MWDRRTGAITLGRFGWKANQPSVSQQVADAFLGDLGITSSLNPAQDCPPVQIACQAAVDGRTPEVDDAKLDRVVFYSRTLAVPARRDLDQPGVKTGAAVFAKLGCGACHTGTLRTGPSDIPQLAGQTIHPYTDLLLHDMGDGLADGRPDFAASGREWRTPPLWGIGLVERVNGHTRFLHDGRARSLEEAILFHGGEAARVQAAYRKLPARDRAALLEFLRSL